MARAYSRHNYNATDFYNTSALRSSDHDPIVVGLDAGTPLIETKTAAYSSIFGIGVAVTAGKKPAAGGVELYDGDRKLATARLDRGLDYFSPRLYPAQSKDLRVVYTGSDTHAPSEAKVTRLF